jgi:hypothetical protein
LYREIEAKVKAICHQIDVEIGGAPDSDQMELIVSAGGDRQLFELVDAFVDLAPTIPGWTIHALRPPLGEDAEIEYEGVHLSTGDIFFSVVSSAEARPLQIRLTVTTSTNDTTAAREGALFLTESTVGERAATTSVEIVDVVFRNANDLPAGSRPIRELVKLVAH